MQFISCHNGKLQTLTTAGLNVSPTKAFVTGLGALDELAPRGTFARGAVHELLFDANDGQPRFVAAMLARAAASSSSLPLPYWGEGRGEGGARELSIGAVSQTSPVRLPRSPLTLTLSPVGEREPELESASIVWADPRHEIYPPALAALGFDLTKLYILRPPTEADEAWAVAECL